MIVNIIIGSVAFYVGGMLLSGVQMKSVLQCVIVAIVIGILDFTLGNFLRIVSLGILTLGIFNWLLNAILIQVADWFLPGFKVKNFWWALGLAAIVSIVSGLLSKII
jgi:putative membrane protein